MICKDCHPERSEGSLRIWSRAKLILHVKPYPKSQVYYAYIVASVSGTLYAGVTNDLQRRVYEHKMKLVPGFTSKYNVNRLVWYEHFSQVRDEIACEKRIKGWTRKRKIALIQSSNPSWNDLSAEWSDSDDEQVMRDPSLRSG